jgi:hypothetical protein
MVIDIPKAAVNELATRKTRQRPLRRRRYSARASVTCRDSFEIVGGTFSKNEILLAVPNVPGYARDLAQAPHKSHGIFRCVIKKDGL